MQDTPPPDDNAQGGLIRFVLLAAIGGAITGLLGGLFRVVLLISGDAWLRMLAWARDIGGWRVLLPVLGAALAVALARWIVRWSPEAAGSGIQRVEAMVRHEDYDSPVQVIPAKFVGGTLAIGVGMALGREGPTVQMGSAVGGALARRTRLDDHDRRTLQASLAGAGLGVAFSAPLGGAMFVLEELDKAIRTRLLVAVLISSSVALAVAYPLVGRRPVLPVSPLDPAPSWQLPLFVALGLIAALAGIVYNRLILKTIDVFDAIRGLAPEVKAGAVGALVGALGVAAPWLIGGGEVLADRVLTLSYPLGTLMVILAVRWFLGPLSYSVGTPGGLFAPMLVVGGTLGAVLATAINAVLPAAGLSVTAYAIAGMSAFFAAVVRSPITGLILCVEMTATTSVLVPMLAAAGTTMVVCTVMRSTPIYDSLRERMEQASVRY